MKGKKVTRSLWLILLILMAAVSLFASRGVFAADGDTTWQEDYAYTLDSSDPSNPTITLTKYNGTATDLVLPAEAVVNGVAYRTQIDGEVFRYATIERITIGEANDNRTVKVINGASLFNACNNLVYADLTKLDNSTNPTTAAMFANCEKLETLILPDYFLTSNTYRIHAMFWDSNHDLKLDLSTWDFSGVTAYTPSGSSTGNMWYAFEGIYNIENNGAIGATIRPDQTAYPNSYYGFGLYGSYGVFRENNLDRVYCLNSNKTFPEDNIYNYTAYNINDTALLNVTNGSSGLSDQESWKKIAAAIYLYGDDYYIQKSLQRVIWYYSDNDTSHISSTERNLINNVEDEYKKLDLSNVNLGVYTTADGSNAQFLISKTMLSGVVRPETTFTLTGTKTLTGRDMSAGEFSFEVKVPDSTTATGTRVVATGKNTASSNGVPGAINFDPITYDLSDAGKTYTYTVTEVNNGIKGVTYDRSSFTVKVKVDYDSATQTLSANVVSAESDNVSFSNTYEARFGISLIKEFTTLAQQNVSNGDTFEFSVDGVAGTKAAGYHDDIYVALPNVYGQGSIISFSNAGDYSFLVTEKTPQVRGFTKDDAQWRVDVNVTDIPGGVQISSVKVYKDGVEQTSIYDPYSQMTYPCYISTSGVAVTGFTNDYNPIQYSAEESLTLTADKILNGKTLAADQFSFELLEDGKVIDTASNDASGKISFKAVDYYIFKYLQGNDDEKLGTFNYTVREVTPDPVPEGYKYDNSEYSFKVTAADDGNGKINLTVSGDVAQDGNGYKLIAKDNKKAAFVNEYIEAAEISLGGVKSVENLSLDNITDGKMKDKDYTFVLDEYDGASYKKVSEAQTAADGKFSFATIKYQYTEAGTYYYRISEVAGGKNNILYTATPIYAVVTVNNNGDYTMKAAAKYYKADSIAQVIAGSGIEVFTQEFKNKITEVKVNKTDADGKSLSGANLSIQDKDGNEVYSFTSGEAAVTVYGLDHSKEYKLKETKAPEGYEVASDISFKLNDIGELFVLEGSEWKKADSITMIDKKVTVQKPKEDKPTEEKTTEVKPKEEKPTEEKNPGRPGVSTGDAMAVVPVVILMLSSIAIIVCILKIKKEM